MKKYGILIFLFFFLLFYPFVVVADSGWDYDYSGGYDVGGSYDTGSSYSGGGSSGSSSGIGGYGAPIGIGGGAILFVVALLTRKKKKGNTNTFMPKDNNSVEDSIIERGIEREHHEPIELLDNNFDSVIQKYLPDYTEEKLLKELFDTFVMVQNAWMNFDYDTLEKCCTRVLFESYRSDLETLMESHGKNIMKDYECISSSIRSIEERNNKVYIQMYLFASFYDYVVDMNDKHIVRGNPDAPVRNPYDLEFVMDLEGVTICPSCGSVLNRGECEFCHTLVEKKNDTFVLNKKGIMRN